MSSSCNIKPFTSVNVLPSYGDRTCVISWILSPIYNTSGLYYVNVYKSRDGYTDWYKINPEPIDASLGTVFDKKIFVDKNLANNTQQFVWNYRLELVKKIILNPTSTNPTVRYDLIGSTQAFGPHLSLDEAEFSTLRSMLENEILSHDNVNAFLLRPKGTEGKSIYDPTVNRSETMDYLTQEQWGSSMDVESKGQQIICGFSNPILISITLNQIVNTHTDDPSGQGTTVSKEVAFTSYSFPRFIKGDVIVLPDTDERFVFENYTNEYLFKGLFPFKFDGKMRLIPRNQMEYKLSLERLRNLAI